EGGGDAAARGIAHPANAGANLTGERLNERKNGARVRAQIGFEIEIAAGEQDGDAMIADGAGEKNFVAGAHGLRRDFDAGEKAPDSGGGDVHGVGLAVLDDFCVAAGDADTSFFGGFAHGANFGFQNIGGQTGFEDEGDDDGFGAGTGNG